MATLLEQDCYFQTKTRSLGLETNDRDGIARERVRPSRACIVNGKVLRDNVQWTDFGSGFVNLDDDLVGVSGPSGSDADQAYDECQEGIAKNNLAGGIHKHLYKNVLAKDRKDRLPSDGRPFKNQ
jgi:hypothetical protein